jgi:hypothetical protein
MTSRTSTSLRAYARSARHGIESERGGIVVRVKYDSAAKALYICVIEDATDLKTEELVGQIAGIEILGVERIEI